MAVEHSRHSPSQAPASTIRSPTLAALRFHRSPQPSSTIEPPVQQSHLTEPTNNLARPGRRLSPGLAERLQKLSKHHRQKEETQQLPRKSSIGRIPGEQLEELERLQRKHASATPEVRRRGTVWAAPPIPEMPSGGVRLDGGPVLTDNEASILESDASSVIDISDHFAATDTEDDAATSHNNTSLHDHNKYRLPDVGKTRLHLHTKTPLSPNPRRPAPLTSTQPPPPQPTFTSPQRRPGTASIPATPGSSHVSTPGPYSARMDFFDTSAWANLSTDNLSESNATRPSLSRAGSVYTLGRASFTGQLAQLTSMRLPDATSLAKRISSIPTSTEAVKVLSDASEQIRVWISKASDVLAGLNAEDDVEWAAAGGREGIEDVDEAINRFDGLVQVYISSIERLQTRPDVGLLSGEELTGMVGLMEGIVASWRAIKDMLRGIKEQVELAMEWEKLWNSVLGEIALELNLLNGLVFEMEERRHQSAEGILSSKDTIDLQELETIVDTRPGRNRPTMNNIPADLQVFSPISPTPKGEGNVAREDASLLGLFARMQPLRASLDFLPMRLSVFQIRGNATFPSACVDLKDRWADLEAQYKKLELDAESLRRELGEDRWIVVFRNAGRQALKMCESIQRSFAKLKEAVDGREQLTNAPSLVKKIESYEAKKVHYGPAVERVLAIIDRGVADRLTVNGEILRLQSDMKARWSALQTEMHTLDAAIASLGALDIGDKQLRDSVSTVMSSERSLASSFTDTPGSSPASSVVGVSRKNSFQGLRTPTSLTTFKIHSGSQSGRSSIPLRTPLARKMASSSHLSPNASPAMSTPSKSSPAWSQRTEIPVTIEKPRWQNAKHADVRDFRPLSAYEPSPYAKPSVAPKHNFLRASANPAPPVSSSLRGRVVSTPVTSMQTKSTVGTQKSAAQNTTIKSTPLTTNAASRRQSMQNLRTITPSMRPASSLANGRRSSMMLRPPPERPTDGNEADNESPSHHRRPPSASSGGMRNGSMTSRPRSRLEHAGTTAMPVVAEKPKWRP